MKQTLQLRISQHLALTPQLQQSIRLLQLSTLELHQELEQILTDNPLLERARRSARPFGAPAGRRRHQQQRRQAEAPPRRTAAAPAATRAARHRRTATATARTAASRRRRHETDWGDVWPHGQGAATTKTAARSSKRIATTLREHLMEQMRLTVLRRARPRAGRTDHRRARRQRLPGRIAGRNPRAPAGRTRDRVRRAAHRADAAAKLRPGRRGRAQRVRMPGAADPAHARRADGDAAHGADDRRKSPDAGSRSAISTSSRKPSTATTKTCAKRRP